jgi:large subunit ribosomal protein L24
MTVQTTLLGVAIAFILALLAALIGPYFIDWNQFRPQFEREAARVIGMPVRVDGAIDARLLPTPSLRLRNVAIGARFDPSNASVENLDVEFSLGELLRGAWRANELTLNGLVVELGLDRQGRLALPAAASATAGGFNLGALTVDRFNVTGAASLNDAASHTSLRLDNIVFTGEVRALASALRGEGAVSVSGTRYPFRLATGRAADGNGHRLRINLDPAARRFAADLDGVVAVEDGRPRFDGALTLSRPDSAKGAAAGLADSPWRIGGKLKLDPASATFEQVEAVFGPDDTGLKFTGAGDAHFGTEPRLRGDLSARQLDVDRFLTQGMPQTAQGGAAPAPVEAVAGLRALIAAVPRMPIATELGVDIEMLNVGARPVQNLVLDLKADAQQWRIDRFDLRAPGGARIALAGRLAEPGDRAQFAGSLNLEASDPEGFALWLQGQADTAYRSAKPLKARGEIAIARDRVGIEALQADLDGKPVSGRFALIAYDGGSTRVEAALKAERLDFDATAAFARATGSALKNWPNAALLALDVAQLDLGNQTLKPVAAQVVFDPKTVKLERLRIGDADGVAVDGSGAFDRSAATGRLSLSATAASLDPLSRLVSPIAPALARRIAAIPAGPGNVSLGLTLETAKPERDRVALKSVLDIRTPQIKGALTAALSPPVASLRDADIGALKTNEVALNAKLDAQSGPTLLTLLGLDGVLASDGGPAQLDASASGVWNAPIKVKAKLAGGGVDAEIDGTAEPAKAERAANLAVTIRNANVAPLVGIADPVGAPLAVTLTARAALAGEKLSLDGLDATVGGARVRGKLNVTLGDTFGIDGDVGADSLDLSQAFAAALGAAGRGGSDPLGRGLAAGWRGRVVLSALRAHLFGGEIRPFNAVLRNDGTALTLEGVNGGLGGGQIEGSVSARKAEDGVSLTARVRGTGIDGAALHHRGLAMPQARVSLQAAVSGQGRSASGLLGSLSGNGAVTLAQARLPGLDPTAFEAATRASDAGTARDDAKLAAVVAPALAAGALNVASADIQFTVRDGQLRVSPTMLTGEGARLNLSGGYDINADQFDLRAALASTATDPAAVGRPEILVLLFGSPDKPDRTVDVAALSSWLALRAIERETKRLEQIERTNPLLNPPKPDEAPAPPAAPTPAPAPHAAVPPAAGPSAPAPQTVPLPRPAPPQAASSPPPQEPATVVPPLPPPVEVKPAPGARAPQRQSSPLVITPAPRRPASSGF